MEYKSYYQSPIGKIILTSNGEELTGLWFTSTRFTNLREVKEESIQDELRIFKLTKNWLDRYFKGENPNPKEIPIKLVGTDFSHKVWKKIQEIPYGKTITYGEIARRIAKESGIEKMSAQAVGHGVGHNPVSIIVPCHRVVGTNGKLTGYGGGIDKKIALLKIEGVKL